jgi:guanylate kinase
MSNEQARHNETLGIPQGLLIILTGPTASGKTEIRERMTKKYKKIKSLVTTTSRKIREKEQEGVDYHFVSPQEFSQKVEDGDFLEYTEYGGNLYGTTKTELNRILTGELLISTMEISGAAKFADRIRENYDPDTAKTILERTLVVFIDVENDEVLKRRYELRRAGLGDFETRHMQDKNMEAEYGHLFKSRIVNKDEEIEEAVSDVEKLMQTNLNITLDKLD